MGSRPFLKQLLKKMSAKLGAITARKPYCVERPGRVLAAGAAAEVLARQQDAGALVARLVQHEVGVGLALALGHRRARPCPGSATRRTGWGRSRSCLIDLRNCLGMMASVSTFSRSMGATRPLSKVNFCMVWRLVLLGSALNGVACAFNVLAHTLDGVAARQHKGQRQGDEGDSLVHGVLLG